MEADPDFNEDVIGIDGGDVRKAEKELVQYNSELWNFTFDGFIWCAWKSVSGAIRCIDYCFTEDMVAAAKASRADSKDFSNGKEFGRKRKSGSGG